MSDTPMGLKLGQTVPDFELTTFDPVKGDFGKFSLKEQIGLVHSLLLSRRFHLRLSDRVRCSGRAAGAVRPDGL